MAKTACSGSACSFSALSPSSGLSEPVVSVSVPESSGVSSCGSFAAADIESSGSKLSVPSASAMASVSSGLIVSFRFSGCFCGSGSVTGPAMLFSISSFLSGSSVWTSGSGSCFAGSFSWIFACSGFSDAGAVTVSLDMRAFWAVAAGAA